MSLTVHWIEVATHKFHAWPRGARKTLCGRVNAEHLRTHPALQIKATVTPEDAVCRVCARQAGQVVTKESPADTITAAWLGHLRRYVKRSHVQASEKALQGLAHRLAEVGPPESETGGAVFEQVRILFLTPTHVSRTSGRRLLRVLPQLKTTLDLLPATPGILTRLADTLRLWREITRRDPTADRFRSDRVVAVMLEIPTPAPYIQYLLSKDLPHLAAMFHPNTLERARKDTALRGLFAGTTDYWNDTVDQLNIVTD